MGTRRALVVLFVASGLALLPSAPAEAQEAPPPPEADTPVPPSWLKGDAKELYPSALSASLHDEVRTSAESRSSRPGDAITVVVESSSADAARAVTDVGGIVEEAINGLVKASVPLDALAALSATPGIDRVREPNKVQLDTASEGVADTNASAWHVGGGSGTGTRVAILDFGFLDYASLLGSELPASVETDFSRCGGGAWQASDHGTGVAEIVHDMAPGATLRLVCIEDDVDYVSALSTMAANNIDIVNGSFGFFLAGRGDGSGGTGSIAAATTTLRDQGILYVASAGNAGTRHFNITAAGDPVGDDDDFVNIGPGDRFTFRVRGNGVASVGLQWDSWPTTSQDFDLYVGNNTCGLVGASQGFQDGSPGSVPVEGVVFENCSAAEQVFEVVVDRWSGTANPRLDLWFGDDIVSIQTVTGGSIAEPGSSPAAMTVGAYCEATHSVQTYSSRGPTIDGRTKPDIAGPDATSSSVYGPQSGCANGFTGTSAAAPHVAGAAALLLGARPALDVAELQQLLEDRAVEAGAPGKDNAYGSGRLAVGPAGDATLPTPHPLTPIAPTRIFDSRAGTPYPSEVPDRTTPLGPGGKVRVPVGPAGVPADATAVVLNLTGVAPSAATYLSVYPGTTAPSSSNLNLRAGRTSAVHVTATIGTDDKVEVFNAGGNTHVIVDVAGWYGPTGTGGAAATDRLRTLPAPTRAIDSRPGLGYAEPVDVVAPVGAKQAIDVQVAGLGGVPAGATAVVLNLTATGTTKSTFVTAYPTGGAPPPTSSLNARAGSTVANLVVVPVGDDGKITLYNAAGTTHVIADTIGWFEPGAGGAGYIALDPPTRHLDTRSGTGLRRGAIGARATHVQRVGRYDGVPVDAAAVMLGVTAVTPTSGGFLTVYPATATLPTASNLNFAKGEIVPNAVVSRLGTDGRVRFYNAAGSTHVLSDVFGYFIDPANQ